MKSSKNISSKLKNYSIQRSNQRKTQKNSVIQWKTAQKIPMKFSSNHLSHNLISNPESTILPNYSPIQITKTTTKAIDSPPKNQNTYPHSNPQIHKMPAQTQTTKNIITTLIKENSELRKKIYRLEHQMTLCKVNYESKELEFRNVIREYRVMIDSMAQDYGTAEELWLESQVNGSQKFWQKRRECLYEKYSKSRSKGLQIDVEQSFVSKFTRKSQSLNKTNSLKLYQENNADQQLLQGSQTSIVNPSISIYCKQPFKLNSCDYLNFNNQQNDQENKISITLNQLQTELKCNGQPQSNRVHLATLSSATDPLIPYIPCLYTQLLQQRQTVDLMRIIGKKFSAGMQKTEGEPPKAETQRIEKKSDKEKQVQINGRHEKKESGKVSSEAAISISNQSFKAIMEKRIKNRERIQQVLCGNRSREYRK